MPETRIGTLKKRYEYLVVPFLRLFDKAFKGLFRVPIPF